MFQFFLEIAQNLFTLIFLLEAIIKIIAYGNSYFKNSWNQFDFFVVVSSIIDVALEALQRLGGNSKFFSMGPQLARVFRILRITRVIRLARQDDGL